MGVVKRRLIKCLLSLFLVYHLAVMVVLPNGTSLLARSLGPYLIPYANLFAFNTAWQFFSPGPAPMFYLEYQIEKNGDSGDQEMLEYPPRRTANVWSDAYNRRLFGMRYFALVPERLEKYFAPFLCRQSPGAVAISVHSVFEKLPEIQKFDRDSDFRNSEIERTTTPRQRFECGPPAASTDGGEQ